MKFRSKNSFHCPGFYVWNSRNPKTQQKIKNLIKKKKKFPDIIVPYNDEWIKKKSSTHTKDQIFLLSMKNISFVPCVLINVLFVFHIIWKIHRQAKIIFDKEKTFAIPFEAKIQGIKFTNNYYGKPEGGSHIFHTKIYAKNTFISYW